MLQNLFVLFLLKLSQDDSALLYLQLIPQATLTLAFLYHL